MQNRTNLGTAKTQAELIDLPNPKAANILDTDSSDSDDNTSPLDKHIRFMGGATKANDDITFTSTAQQNEFLGDSSTTAHLKAGVVVGGAMLKTGRMLSCPWATTFKPAELSDALRHIYSTGIYKADGTIDEKVWKQLLTFQQNRSEITCLTKTDFYVFLAMRRHKDDEKMYSLTGELASDREWEGFWEKYGLPLGDKEQYVEIANLRLFFEDSKKARLARDYAPEELLPVKSTPTLRR